MKTIQHCPDHFLVILAAICLFHPVLGHSAGEPSGKDIVTTNVADQALCAQQLNVIHGAIQQYLKRNQKLPRWLSDLVPDYLPGSVLVCPFVDRTGSFKEWRKAFGNYPVFSDPGSCSYAYEFCTVEIASVPGLTTREYKQRQMAMIGFGVPVVRCLAHRPILNLAFDGTTYLSPSEWEDNFEVTPRHRATLHNVWVMTLTKKKSFNEIMREMLEPRSPEAGPGALDLTAHYNASLLHLSRIEASGKLLTPYPEGLRKIEQTHFDVRGLVHLAGTNLPIPFPQKVENITVNRKCASVVFLHGAISAVADGTRIASYVLRFGDGTTNVVPVIYGKDVKTRWADPQVDPEINTPPAAWVGPLNKSGPTRESLRLYITRWRNPGRAAELRSIDFISHMTPAAPFLAAITIE